MKVMEIPCEFERLLDDDWREAAVWGGRFSLKSHTVARILLIRARQKRRRIGCFREMQNSIAESSHQLLADLIREYELADFRVTDNSIVNTINGSDFIFKGLYRNEQNIKSTEGIDIAWIEEAQTVSENSIEILTPTVRNDGSQLIYTYNRLEEEDPIHKRLVIDGRPNTLLINVNYDIALKYKLMPEVIRLEMEDDKERRPSLYRHKWLGEPNKNMERRIYKNWAIVEEIPHEAKLVRFALDFGYSNDPTALLAMYAYNGGFIFDELLYRKGMNNKNIADFILSQPEQVMVVADSSEPKSIDEIASYGLTIVGAKKQKEKIGHFKTYNAWAISRVQEQRISLTKRSTATRSEYAQYYFVETKEGKILNEAEQGNDHSMDAIKYGVISMTDTVSNDVLKKQDELFYRTMNYAQMNSSQ